MPGSGRRNLRADLEWLLLAAAGLRNGRVELWNSETRNAHNKRVTRVRAMIMHDHDAPALVGIGNTATEAVNELRRHIEYEAARRAARDE